MESHIIKTLNLNTQDIADSRISDLTDGSTHLMRLVLMVRRWPGAKTIIKSIITDNDIVNKTNIYGLTALILASLHTTDLSDLETVEMLIDAGADVNAVTIEHMSALIGICQYIDTISNLDTLKLLINSNANVNYKTNQNKTALMITCTHPETPVRIQAAQMLIDAGADVNIVSQSDWGSAILHTCIVGSLTIAKMLIAANADVNHSSRSLQTPLLFVCSDTNDRSSNIDMVRILLESGADPNKGLSDGWTPLMSACENGASDIVELLIQNGANVNAKNGLAYHNGLTALWDSACNSRVTKLLMNDDTDYKMKNEYGRTLLMQFIDRTDILPDIVIDLIHNCAQTVLDVDNNRKTAYDYYVERGHDFLDEHHLRLLRGETTGTMTKSARN